MKSLDPTEAMWLCRVERLNSQHEPPLGTLAPLAWASETGWTDIASDEVRARFPDRGLIFWYDAPAEACVDDLVTVRPERRRNYPQAGETEAFQVADWTRAVEVLDLRAWEGERAVRIALTQDGLDLALTTPRVLVRLDDETAAGPLTLERTANGRWRVAESEHEDVEVRRLLDEHVSRATVGSATPTLVHDPHGVSRPVRLLNWTDDKTLALGLLGRLRKLDQKAANALEVTKTVYRQYVESYPGFEISNDRTRDQEAARFERVAGFVEVVARDERLLEEAARALLDHPLVAASLEGPKRAAVERAYAEARAEAAETLASAQSDVEDARREQEAFLQRRDQLLEEVTAAERSVADARRAAQEQVEEVERALDARLADLAAKPAELFAQAAVLRALSPSVTSLSSTSPAAQTQSATTSVNPGSVDPSRSSNPARPPQTIQTPKEAASALAQRLASSGDVLLGLTVAAAFLTGRAVVAAGDATCEVLRATADVLAGGRMLWIPMSPALSAPDELLGRFDPTSGQFVPHPGGLLAALDAAPAGLSLVVLEGYDRAPAEHYLAPLVAAYADAGRKRSARTIPIVGAGGEARLVAWPPNVLLACVPGQGSGAIPPGPSFWRHAALVDVGDALPSASPPDVPTSQVLTEAWTTALQGPCDGEPSLEGVDGAPRVSGLARRFYGLALDLGLPAPMARRAAFTAAWLPTFRSAAEGADAARRALGADAPPLDARVAHLLETVRPL